MRFVLFFVFFLASTSAVAQETLVYQPSQPRKVQQRIVEDAINRSISGMSFVTRGVARKQLSSLLAPPRRVEVAYDDAEVMVRMDGQKVASPADGETVVRKARGKRLEVSQELRDDGVLQRVETDHGGRTVRLEWSPDRRALEMRVEVHSPKLPAPIRYVLEFVRAH